MTPEQHDLITRIRESAKAIERAVTEIPAAQHEMAPATGEWSVKQILLHTRDVAMLAYGLRVRRIVVEDAPSFASYNEEEYRPLNPGAGETASDLAHTILAEHFAVAGLLTHLPDAFWQKTGQHPEYGTTTLEFFARRLAEHAEEHAEQISDFKF